MDINISFHLPISPTVLVLSVVFLINLLLAWRVWRSNSKHPVNIFFALAILMAGLWTFGLLVDAFYTGATNVSGFLRFIHFAPIPLVFFFYLFTYYFPYKTFKLSKKQIIVLLFFTALISVIEITPGLMIAREVPRVNTLSPYYNYSLYLIFVSYFIVMAILAFSNLFLKYRKSAGVWRRRLRQVIIATSVAFVGGSLCNLILPFFLNRYILEGYLAPIFTIFTAFYIWYTIFWKPNRVDKG